MLELIAGASLVFLGVFLGGAIGLTKVKPTVIEDSNEYLDEITMVHVYQSIDKIVGESEMRDSLVNQLLNDGILFRERRK